MENFINFYQHMPEHINPNFKIGFFSISWYSIMYLVAFAVVYFLLVHRINRGEYGGFQISNPKKQIPNKFQNSNSKSQNTERKEIYKLKARSYLADFLLYVFIGLLIGARLGYVLFYNFNYYAQNPLAIISPFDSAGNFIGIYGMSYHGGLIGILVCSVIFCKKNKINFWALSDFIVPAVPLAYFFGRLGNFINGELYGRATKSALGMYFPSDPTGLLRHPSQLYEAFLEGIVLFLVFWPIRNNPKFQGNFLALYLVGYSIARFAVEFFREPDEQIGYILGFLTMGQVLSLIMMLFGALLYFRKYYFKKTKNLV